MLSFMPDRGGCRARSHTLPVLEESRAAARRRKPEANQLGAGCPHQRAEYARRRSRWPIAPEHSLWSGLRWPLALAVALAMTAPPPAALAAEAVSGYGNTPSTPHTTSPEPRPEAPEPHKPEGVEPRKPEERTKSRASREEVSKPEERDEPPEGEPKTHVSSRTPPSSRTLPFTGIDLRWQLGVAALLIMTGWLVLLAERRREFDRRPQREELSGRG